MPLKLRQLLLGPMQNFVYVLGSTESAEGAVVDVAWDVPAVLAAARDLGLALRHAIVTHTHPDHVNGLPGLLEALPDVRVHVNPLEAPRLAHLVGQERIHASDPGTTLVLGDVTLRFLHTPGHTPGSQCVLVSAPAEAEPGRAANAAEEAAPSLVAGDTLFVGHCGRCDLPGGDPEMMFHSLSTTLGELPAATILLPGHDYGATPTSTLRAERADNPYLRCADAASFVAFRMRGPRPAPKPPPRGEP